MPLPRMTTRRWKIAVAVVGVMSGTYTIWRRACWFRQRAAYYTNQEAIYRAAAAAFRAKAVAEEADVRRRLDETRKSVPRPDDPAFVASMEILDISRKLLDVNRDLESSNTKEANYLNLWRKKYERAARRPWLPEPPDPDYPD